MTVASTTIRVSTEQRDLLRELAAERSSSMTDTLQAALEALRRELFYRAMSAAEAELRSEDGGWADYVAERDAWLGAELT